MKETFGKNENKTDIFPDQIVVDRMKINKAESITD